MASQAKPKHKADKAASQAKPNLKASPIHSSPFSDSGEDVFVPPPDFTDNVIAPPPDFADDSSTEDVFTTLPTDYIVPPPDEFADDVIILPPDSATNQPAMVFESSDSYPDKTTR